MPRGSVGYVLPLAEQNLGRKSPHEQRAGRLVLYTPAYRPSSTRVLLSNSYGPDFLGQAYVAEACRNKAPSFQPPEVEFADCAGLLLVGYQRVERGVGDV